MTILEMQQLFEELLQTSSPAYNDSDKPDTTTILRFLNTAQYDYISKKYLSEPSYSNRTKLIGTNLNDLKNLIRTITFFNSPLPPYPNSILLKPDSLAVWHYLSISGALTRTYTYSTSNTLIDFTPIDSENLNQYLTTSINTPIILVPVYTNTLTGLTGATDDNSGILVVYDRFTTINPASVRAQVMVYPRELVLETPPANTITQTNICDLATYLHDDIVKLAVALYEQQKYKLMGGNKKETKEE